MQKQFNEIKNLIAKDITEARNVVKIMLGALQKQDADLDKAEVYHLVGLVHFYSDEIKEAIKWYNREIKMRQKMNDLKGLSDAFNNIGAIYYNNSKLEKAKEFYEKALSQRELMNDLRGMAGCYDNIGAVLLKSGEVSDALKMHFRALKINQDINDIERVGFSLQNIGLAYYTQGDFGYALENYQESLAIARSVDDKVRAIQLMINIGAALMKQNNLVKAKIYYKKCYEESKFINYHHGVILSLHNLADIELNKGNYKECIQHYMDCIHLAQTSGHKAEIVTALTGIGQSFGFLKDFSQSLKYLHDALVMAKKTAIKESISDIYLQLSAIYGKQGEYKRALDFYKKHISLRDDLVNKETTKTIQEIKTRYEVDKKEKESEINRLKNIELKNALDALTLAKQQSDSLLLNILPAGVADELKSKGAVTAQYYEQAAVIFIDIKDLTKLSENLNPQALVSEIDIYFSMFDSIIERYPIEKIKTIGDAYLCVAGLPIQIADCTGVAARAAIDIRDSLQRFNQARAAEGRSYFEFRIGLHSGPLVAGVVGRKKFEYDIWGDTVNTAARMEQHSEAGYINISQEAYLRLKDKFQCTYRGKLDAKNKGLIDMYFVERELAPPAVRSNSKKTLNKI